MTNFDPVIDGSIVGFYLLMTMAAGLYVRKYVGKVEDFLVAGREVNVYLGIASLAATEFGIVTCMYAAQNGYQFGFAGATPGILYAASMLFVGWSGFVVKPLRESGALTIPELIDRKFGGNIRWASGVVIVLGGLLNMGVFLRIGGEFLLLVTGNDTTRKLSIAGFELPMLETMMTLLLLAVAAYTIFGGMLSVLVTDFLQFVVMSVGLIAVTFLIVYTIGWDALVTVVETEHGAGGFNPFVNPEMGFSYVLFNAFLSLAAVLTWQTNIARVLAAKDAKTGQQIYTRTAFFFVCRFLIPGLWGIAALAMVSTGMLMEPSSSLHAMPTMLAAILPIGLMGLLIAAMLAADMSTDSSYMLTWSSVIYNDILAPFRKGKNWSERTGLFINRTLVALIGIFLLFYGLWYPLQGDLWTYLGLTGTIYLASMSVILIAACYWKGANAWGAAASIVVSAFIPVAYLTMEKGAGIALWLSETAISLEAEPGFRSAIASAIVGIPGLVGFLNESTELAKAIGPHYSGIAAYVGSIAAMFLGSKMKHAFFIALGAVLSAMLLSVVERFWLTMLILVMVWYTFVTLYVAVKGSTDIREMLESLDKKRDE